jgi:hypothetical protein
MTVALSILLAALVGGVVFVLLDSWQRGADPVPVEPEPVWRAPEPSTQPLPVWAPESHTEPLPRRTWDADDRDEEDPPPPGLWSGWAR